MASGVASALGRTTLGVVMQNDRRRRVEAVAVNPQGTDGHQRSRARRPRQPPTRAGQSSTGRSRQAPRSGVGRGAPRRPRGCAALQAARSRSPAAAAAAPGTGRPATRSACGQPDPTVQASPLPDQPATRPRGRPGLGLVAHAVQNFTSLSPASRAPTRRGDALLAFGRLVPTGVLGAVRMRAYVRKSWPSAADTPASRRCGAGSGPAPAPARHRGLEQTLSPLAGRSPSCCPPGHS